MRGVALGAVSALIGYLLVCTFWSPGIATSVGVVLCAVALCAAWNAQRTLVALAAALPIITYVTRTVVAPDFEWPIAIVAAYCCGYFAYLARRHQQKATDRILRTPVLILTAVILAAVVVELAALEARLGGAAFRTALARMLGPDFFIANSTLPGIAAATLLLSGLTLLYAAATFARWSVSFPRALARALVLGTTAAALANVWRLAEVAGRAAAPIRAFARLVLTQRVNVQFTDLNAAGSLFVLVLSVAVALSWRRRAWVVPALMVATALWLSGSRSAVIAGVIASMLPIVAPNLSRLRRRDVVRGGLVAAALLAVAAAAALWLPARGNQKAAGTAIEVRVELARTSMRMLAARPVFGLGPGEFYQRTGEFSSPRLLAIFPVARNENAHNNFLQILAELGVTGFAAFVWILGVAMVRGIGLLLRTPRDPVSTGFVTGLVAFLLTWMGGHPLLIPDVAAIFWIVGGVVCGWGFTEPRARPLIRPSVSRTLAIAAAALLVATLPLRARRQVADTNLEHVGIGLTAWRQDDGGRLYREGGMSATVFVPADAGSVTIPLRAAGDGDELKVELRLDGQLADAVQVGSSTWTDALLVLPRNPGARYRPVQLRVSAGAAAHTTGVLLVGKVIPH